jgi:lysophospholipase L1-like esterase
MAHLDPTGVGVSQSPRPAIAGSGKPLVVLFGGSRIAQRAPLPVLADYRVISRGVSGQTTAQALLRLEEDVLAARPRAVVIQIGINDLKTLGVFRDRGNMIVGSCRSAPTPRVVKRDQRLRGRGERVAARSEERSCTVLDCSLFLSPTPGKRHEYARDALHLAQAGYEVLNRHVISVLWQVTRD